MALKGDWTDKNYQKTANKKKNKTTEFLTDLNFLKYTRATKRPQIKKTR